MASATTAAGESNGGALKADSVRIVDLRLLSQSELYALSRCAPSPTFCDDVVIPKIDRSVFNESAGSRKQTYSRLRLAPPEAKQTSRRRTPHVRPTALTNTANSDPENAENAQIVSMLKKLFMPNADPLESGQLGQLVNVKVDYSDTVLPEQLVSNVSPVEPVSMDYSNSNTAVVTHQLVPSVASVSGSGQKRKRGRPRKDEMVRREVERAPSNVEVRVENDLKEKVTMVPLASQIFKQENGDDRDKELLNRDGVAVDLVKLGAVEHPFWDEVTRRTEGRRTEEELLEFLKDLEGQWGSRRKKKRIVDASEFGDALPVGWKVLLSCKKKNGVVWLYCRRYISPSGRQFVSCKDVSSYLLSLHGIQDSNADLLPQKENAIESTSATELSQASDFAAPCDARMELPAPGASTPAQASDAAMKTADKSEGRGRETLHCKKCNVSFTDKAELLQHKSSLHPKNRSKNSVSIADGVIIREDGIFECRFCQKTYTELHRMTGHIGAHVKYREKMAGELPPEGTGGSVDPVPGNEFRIQDTTVGSEGVSASINNALKLTSPCDKDSTIVEHAVVANVEGSEDANMNIRGSDDEATVIVTATSPTPDNEVLVPKDEDNDFPENPDDSQANDSTAEIVPDGSILQVMSDNCSPSPFDGNTDGATEISASVENAKQDIVADSDIIDSSNYMEACDTSGENVDAYQTRNNELKLDGETFAANETTFDFLESGNGQEKDTSAVDFLESGNGQVKDTSAVDLLESGNGQEKDTCAIVEQQSDFANVRCKNTSNIECSSTSGSTLSKCSEMNPVFNIGMLAPSNDEKSPAEENVCSINRGANYETHSFGICEKRSSEVNYAGESRRHEEMNVGISSLFPSWSEQETLSEKYNSDSLLNESRVHNNSERRLVAGHESNQAPQTNDNICGRKPELSPFDDIQSIRGSEVSDPFGGSFSALNSDSLIDKGYPREDNVFKLFGSVEDQNQKPSGSVLFGQSAEVSHTGYTGSEIYPTPMNQSKLKEFETPREHDLSLSFGNFQKEMQTDSNRVELDRYSTESFNFQPAVPQNYGDQSRSNVLDASRTCDVLSFRNLRTEQQRGSNRTEQEQFLPESFNFQPFVPQNYVDQTRLSVVNPNRPGGVFPFANVQKELEANSDRVEQAKYSTGSFNFQSHVSQNYGDQTRLGVGNTNTQDNVKQARQFGIDFLDSSFNRANELPGSLNMPPTGVGWNRSTGVKLGTPDQNMILGFGRSSSQSVDGLANSPWTTGRGNDYQDSFGIAPAPQVQASTGFGAFNLRQNQGQGSSYGITESYNGGTSTYGASRPEPVEYSFMGQSPNSLPGDSKIYQYEASAEQGLNPSYWLGKDALMHGIAPATQVPAECAWCKSVFYHDPVQSGVHSGAIGVICPSCSSRYQS